ncbi:MULTISPECIES: hypothetical protein [Streptomyces]|uniref:Glycosyltransferase RgtA/B/C/D-like domain-containing protein n=1 Tax=Streptomyces luteosporeus TaxID=173856 RepID=A0ABN3U2Z6_9ACTN
MRVRGHGPGARLPHRTAVAAAVLLTVLLLLMVVRLPWSGDLGMHAAVLERLRTDLIHPGNPLVDADTASPYYSPWTVALALVADATGRGTFGVLRLAGLAGLAVLGTGIAAFVRTFTRARTAVPLALLCFLLLYGTVPFAWSGVPGLTSLSLTLAYPSTLALGLTLHLWALLRRAVRDGWGLGRFLGLGALLGLVLLVHQFTGAVAVLGAVALLLGSRPWPDRTVRRRLAAGAGAALVLPLCWPYYSFLALLDGGRLNAVHRHLYAGLPTRFGLLAVGAVALGMRWRRDHRDPLVLMFVLGSAVFAAGGLGGHYAWGRVLPAVLIPPQIALAAEAAGALEEPRTTAGARLRRAVPVVTAVALAAGAWGQAGALTYVLHRQAIPPGLRHARVIALWPDFGWAARRVPRGATVLTADYYALRSLPAYGPYTVAPAYPDLFLPDEERRHRAVRRYFAPTTSRAERLGILKEYGVRWVLQKNDGTGPAPGDPALRPVAQGPRGLTLMEVVAR